MTVITVLSLNMQGVSATTIANAINTIGPDLVALQEAPAGSTFRNGLQALIDNRYAITTPLREYSPPRIGGYYLDGQTAKNYLFVYDSQVLKVLGKLTLVDFLSDKNIKRPRTVLEARLWGFTGRPPAYIKFRHRASGKVIGVFSWHAPIRTDHAHFLTLQHFDRSHWLFKERVNNDLTLLVGDFNNSKIDAYFRNFDDGIQHKFDYILSDNSTQFEDLSHGPHQNLLDMVHTKSQDHFMMGARITF